MTLVQILAGAIVLGKGEACLAKAGGPAWFVKAALEVIDYESESKHNGELGLKPTQIIRYKGANLIAVKCIATRLIAEVAFVRLVGALGSGVAHLDGKSRTANLN